ncbi:MAG: histidine kinase [Bacteroidia bacterium]
MEITQIHSHNQSNTKKRLGFRLLFLISIGMLVPHLSGLLCTELTPVKYLIISYLYFSALAFILWHTIGWITRHKLRHFKWEISPKKRLLFLILTNSLITIGIVFIFTIFWYAFIVGIRIEWRFVLNTEMLIILCVIISSSIHEMSSLIQNAVLNKIYTSSLENTHIKTELEILRNQIDPHFLFNALNTLSYLIEHDSKKALQFNQTLANVYHYILRNKEIQLISLEKELEFARQYFELLKIRFSDSIHLDISDERKLKSDTKLPPISLQLLIENAIKHNAFDEHQPLTIQITVKDDGITVLNTLKPKQSFKTSLGIGLKNLNERYKLQLKQELHFFKSNNHFTVKLPI